MAAPVQYLQTYNFNQDELNQIAGRSTLKTSELDFELANIVLSISQLITNLGLIQRSDGALKDLSVSPASLAAATLLLIGSNLWLVRGTWLTATTYAAKDMVVNGTGTYVCAIAHTSGVFATDLTAGKWVKVFDTTNYAASGITFTPVGNIAATDVQAALAEVDSEHNLKTANLSDVANVATSRANLSVLSKAEVQNQAATYSLATGSSDAIVGAFTPAITALVDGMELEVEAIASNGTTAPTFTPNTGVIAAKTIVKQGNLALTTGDIKGAGHRLKLSYHTGPDNWELLNPSGSGTISQVTALDFFILF